jgi:hypothetical protein
MNKQSILAVPDENRVEELLGKIQPVPSENFHQKMKQAAWRTENFGFQVKSRSNQRVRLALAMIALFLLAGLLISPQGRAWAQDFLQFFIRTESDQLPLQPWQLTPYPTPTISATMLSIANAEEQIGFDAREFIASPAELTLQGARVEGEVIYIDYVKAENTCRLTLAQTLNGEYPDANLWSRFAAGDIQTVKIGEFDGELFHDSSSTPPVVRLLWEQPDDGFPPPSLMGSSDWRPGILSLELIESCVPGSMEYLDDDSLIRLALRTVHTRWYDPLVDVEQAERQVGFSVLKLPNENAELFTLVGASVDPQYRLLTLVYHSPDGSAVQSGRTFTIEKWPTTEPIETCDLCAAIGASAQVITISVRGTTGEYVQGVWNLTNVGPRWEPVPHRKIIRWQEDGYWLELGMWSSLGSHTMEDLIAIAEDLK